MHLSGRATVVFLRGARLIDLLQALEWTLVTVVFLFLALRMYVRVWKLHTFLLSDILVILAWVSFVAACACDLPLNALGLFSADRDYTDALIVINKDESKTIEALKVALPKKELIIDNIWFSITILYSTVANQVCSSGFLLRTYHFPQKKFMDSVALHHRLYDYYIYRRYLFEYNVLPANFFQLVYSPMIRLTSGPWILIFNA
jgi:hypothetical protein